MFKFLKSIKLLVVFTAFFTLFGCGDDTPEAVAKAFVSAMYDADAEKALSYLDYSRAKNEQDAAAYKEMMTGKFKASLPRQKMMIDEQFGGVKEIEVADIDYLSDSMDKASVKVKVIFNKDAGGKDHKIEHIRLIKIDGNWKVNI